MGREMLAEEVIEDMPGNLATDTAPERIVRMIAVGNHEKDIRHSGLCQFRDHRPVPAGRNQMILLPVGDECRRQIGSHMSDRRDGSVSIRKLVRGTADIGDVDIAGVQRSEAALVSPEQTEILRRI